MNITELYGLAKWYETYYNELRRLYNGLQSTLQHNASQPNQMPVEEKLTELVSFLQTMQLGELSLHQLKLLSELKVEEFLGPIGANRITEIVKTASYDPATTASKLNAAVGAINDAFSRLSAYSLAIVGLGIEPKQFEPAAGQFIVRVGFKDDAAIENIADWKNSADDWFLIIRGLALVSGEAPEDTKILGVANGSIILILATTCVVTSLLARIAKHITGISKEVISLGMEVENLRQKKILTKTMQTEFIRLQKSAREDGLKAINQELEKAIPTFSNATPEARTAIEKSIEKILKFGEDGGDLDFIVPPQEEDLEEAVDEASSDVQSEIEQVRKFVNEYQETRESIKLLENSTTK